MSDHIYRIWINGIVMESATLPVPKERAVGDAVNLKTGVRWVWGISSGRWLPLKGITAPPKAVIPYDSKG